MDIETLVDLVIDNPKEFEVKSKQYIEESIKRMCGSDGQCVWRANAEILRLDWEVKKIKNPIARFNFVQRRFWNYINDNY